MDRARWQYLKQLRPHSGWIFWPSSTHGRYCENNNARKEATREDKARERFAFGEQLIAACREFA